MQLRQTQLTVVIVQSLPGDSKLPRRLLRIHALVRFDLVFVRIG